MTRFEAMLAFLAMTWPLTGHSQAGDFEYAATNGTITITGYSGRGGAVTIPSRINDLPVTALGNWAFANSAGSSITSVVIPDGVVTIGSMAFYYCTGLRSVTMPPTLKSIGDVAFAHCTSLSSVTIPNGVEIIGASAFGSCIGLTSIVIPQSVTNVGTLWFAGCSSLSAINVDPSNPVYTSIAGVLFDKGRTVILKFPEGGSGAYTIPAGVTHIGDGAFSGCSKLIAVTLPDKLASIGGQAFSGCVRLTSIKIPDTVTTVGSWAFQGCDDLCVANLSTNLSAISHAMFIRCSGLTNIVIPGNVTNIEDFAFYSCSTLAAVTVPASVVGICDYAFSGCGLTDIALSSGLVRIGDSAFEGCPSLASITVPDTVTSIGGRAFQFCPSLVSIHVAPLNAVYSDLDGVLVDKNQTTIFRFPMGKEGSFTVPQTIRVIGNGAFRETVRLTTIIFPEGLQSIEPYAFYGCTGLAGVGLPDSLMDLGFLAFAGCGGLSHISFGTNFASVGDSAFEGCTGVTNVLIPQSLARIGLNVFAGCSNLLKFQVSEHNTTYSSVDGVLFDEQRKALIGYPAGRCGSYTVPEGVTTIGPSAFRNSYGLTNVVLPSSLTNIEEYSFSSCSGLISVIIPASVKFIGNFAFAGCANLRGLYFEGDAPRIGAMFFNGNTEATVYFMPGTTGWPLMFGGVPTVFWKPSERWLVTGAPTKSWSAVACSADGSRILAASRVQAESGSLWISTDSGATWVSNNVPGHDWVSVAVSTDGARLFAAAGPGICISTNAGQDWREADPAPNVQWSEVACSADGMTLLASGNSLLVTNNGATWWTKGLVYISHDAGATWKLSFGTEMLSDQHEAVYITGLASSADGSRLMAIDQGPSYTGSLFTSDNRGLTWVTNQPNTGSSLHYFRSVACSADARTVVLCRLYDSPGVFLSRNNGFSWAGASTNSIWSITCSADGATLAALDTYGLVHISADAGTTWTRESLPHRSDAGYLACSADGSTLVAAVPGGGIYLRQTIPIPRLGTRVEGEELALSWVWPARKFLLQRNADLGTTNWLDVLSEPLLNGTSLKYELRVPMTGTGCWFYRLVSR